MFESPKISRSTILNFIKCADCQIVRLLFCDTAVVVRMTTKRNGNAEGKDSEANNKGGLWEKEANEIS